MTAPHERYRLYLEALTPDRLSALADHVTEDVRFKDPFNDVRGVDAMRRVFRHMFEAVGEVRFRVTDQAWHDDVYLMAWRFEATLRGKPWVFDGMSRVRFSADGRVAEHVDHWDAGRDFYEHLPVIGWMLAWLRGRLAIR